MYIKFTALKAAYLFERVEIDDIPADEIAHPYNSLSLFINRFRYEGDDEAGKIIYFELNPKPGEFVCLDEALFCFKEFPQRVFRCLESIFNGTTATLALFP